MRIEKMNSSLQQRDFDSYKKIKYNDDYQKEENEKKKSLRELFEEEENDNQNQQENQRVV